jgi:uncharacterized protein YkwD
VSSFVRYFVLCCFFAVFAGLFSPTRAIAEGEAINGYPNWSERVMLEWMNRSRSAPQADLAGCPAGSCLESACYSTASPPRHLDQNLEHSARFHADHMMINDYFDHPSYCSLSSTIATTYPNVCAGAASCSCTQGALTTNTSAWTDPFTRMGMFGAQVGAAGEIIAAGYSGPDDAFYGWLYEPATTSSCGFTQSNGHRYLILTNGYGPSAGSGYVTNSGAYPDYSSYAVMDFAGSASDTYKIPSGAHYPQQAASVNAWANWYDSAGPSVAQIDVDGVCSNMTLQRGTQTNGAWLQTVSGVGSGCHRYLFAFKDSAGNAVLYPTTGSLGIGDGSASCPDWTPIAPSLCAGFGSGVLPAFPVRILDTRAGYTTSDGLFAATGAVGNAGMLNLTALGRGGVPASGVVAVALNVTATNPTATGYATVWPTASGRPNASNLNFVPGQTIPNLVIAAVGSGGDVSLFNSAGRTDLIADVAWYFTAASQLTALNPARVLDTRVGNATIDGQFAGVGAVSGGNQLNLTVVGRGGLPASGVGAVVMNVTATNPTAAGYVTAWPTDHSRPNTSNLNFVPGQTIPNLVISAVSANGQVSLFNSSGRTDLIADVMGWFPVTSALTALVPARVLDTRVGMSTIDGQFGGGGAITAANSLDLTVLGRGGVPAAGVGAVVLNVTATNTTAAGFLTVWPSGNARPNASNLNFAAGQTIPNLVIAMVGSNGKVSLFNSGGTTDIIVDVVGWLAPGP